MPELGVPPSQSEDPAGLPTDQRLARGTPGTNAVSDVVVTTAASPLGLGPLSAQTWGAVCLQSVIQVSFLVTQVLPGLTSHRDRTRPSLIRLRHSSLVDSLGRAQHRRRGPYSLAPHSTGSVLTLSSFPNE